MGGRFVDGDASHGLCAPAHDPDGGRAGFFATASHGHGFWLTGLRAGRASRRLAALVASPFWLVGSAHGGGGGA